MSIDGLRLKLFYDYCDFLERLYFEWKQYMKFYLYGNTSNPFKQTD